MYGPLTHARRDLTMKERILLKTNKKIISAYVAKVMAKPKRDGKYECIKDFSKVAASSVRGISNAVVALLNMNVCIIFTKVASFSFSKYL